MKDDRLSTQEDRESHIREKVTNRVEPQFFLTFRGTFFIAIMEALTQF
jgi:hypothetical protein